MYNEHFGLSQAPFRITPDTRLFYTGGGRGDVLDALVYAVTSGEGIVKVVGEVGTGKTMLCRMLEERLPDNVQIAYLANPSLTPDDILHAIALELGLQVASDAPRLQVMHALQQELLERHAQNRRVVALVEEAQSMPVGTLEEIRLLSNLETKNEKLLQIILFGQPELDDNLSRPEIRQLRERITHSFKLKPLAADEVKDYVAFRLRASGYRGRDAFSRHAYRAVTRASEGLTRRVNIIADKAMLAAYADDTHDVSSRHVKVAIRDCEFDAPRRSSVPRPALRVAAAAAAALLAGGVGWYLGAHRGDDLVMASSKPPAAAEAAVARVPSAAAVSDAAAPSDPASGMAPATITAVDEPAERVAKVVTNATPGLAAMKVSGGAAPVSQAAQPAAPRAAAGPKSADRKPAEPGAVEPRAAAQVAATGTATAPRIAEPAAAMQPAAPRAATVAKAVAPSPALIVASAPVATMPETMSARAVTPQRHETLQQALAVTAPAPAPDSESTARSAVSSPTASPMAATAGERRGAAPPATATASAAVAAPSRAGTAPPADVVEQRLATTRRWLERANPRHFSIQLLATDARQRHSLEAFLLQRSLAGQLDQVFVYETFLRKRKWYGVLLGDFSTYSEARSALKELPEELQRHRPFIRNISDIEAVG